MWTSKINWTQIVALIASALILIGFELTPEMQLQLIAGIQVVQSVLTWVFRTWFTKPAT